MAEMDQLLDESEYQHKFVGVQPSKYSITLVLEKHIFFRRRVSRRLVWTLAGAAGRLCSGILSAEICGSASRLLAREG